LQTATGQALYEKMKDLSGLMFQTIEEWDTLAFIDQ